MSNGLNLIIVLLNWFVIVINDDNTRTTMRDTFYKLQKRKESSLRRVQFANKVLAMH